MVVCGIWLLSWRAGWLTGDFMSDGWLIWPVPSEEYYNFDDEFAVLLTSHPLVIQTAILIYTPSTCPSINYALIHACIPMLTYAPPPPAAVFITCPSISQPNPFPSPSIPPSQCHPNRSFAGQITIHTQSMPLSPPPAFQYLQMNSFVATRALNPLPAR